MAWTICTDSFEFADGTVVVEITCESIEDISIIDEYYEVKEVSSVETTEHIDIIST